MIDPAPALAPAPTASPWLTVADTTVYLGITVHAAIELITHQHLSTWMTPGGNVLVHRTDLDALICRCSPEEAVAALSRSGLFSGPLHPSPTDPKGLSMSTSPVQGSIAHITAKQAAPLIGLSYKTLLRLIHEGVVPAIDLNAGTGHGRPRFTVDPVAAKDALVAQAQSQQQARKPAGTNLDLRRLLTVKPEGKSA